MNSLYLRICIQGFFFWFAYDLARFPVIPLLAQKLGLPPEAIGFAVAASTITGIFGKSIAGGLSDSLGRKGLMLFACIVATLLPATYFLANDATSLITIRLFHGLGTAIMGPVGRAFVVDLVPAERRGNLLSTYTAGTNLGTMAGRSLAGFLLFWGGFFFPFAASALAGLIALIMVLQWPRDQREPFQASLFRKLLQGFREVGSNRVVCLTSVAEAVQYMTMGAVDAFLPIYAKERVGLSDWQIGLLYGTQVATTILLKPVLGWVSDKIGRKPQIVGGLLFGGLLVWRLPWERSFGLLILLIAGFGAAVALTTSATSALITDVCERRHYGVAHGLFGTFLDTGHALGPISAGFLIGTFDFRPSFLFYGFVLILTSLFFGFLVKAEHS